MAYLFQYLIGANIICFFAFAIDKFIAKFHLNCKRIPEQTLFGLLMLGPIGGLAGMIFCCHKTRKGSFWIRVILCCALHFYLLIQFIQKKYQMMTDPASLGIDGVETPMMESNDVYGYSDMTPNDGDETVHYHPEL